MRRNAPGPLPQLGPRPEPDFEETGGITEPEAPQFAALKGFQSVLMARITSPQYREWFDSDPGKAAAQFGLIDRDWITRLEKSDPHGMEKLAYSWSNIQKDDRMVEEEYEKSEWEAWADQIAIENASTVSS